MTHQERAKQAIDILDEAKRQINELYDDSPELKIRADNTLKRLQNGFAHAGGLNMQFEIEHVEAAQPAQRLTHVMGIAITVKEPVKVEAAIPTKSEADELDGFLKLAYADFQTNDPAELMEAYNELVIRALAKKVGMRVTETEPANIDVAFVQSIKDVILKQVDDAKPVAAAPVTEKEEKPKTEKKK